MNLQTFLQLGSALCIISSCCFALKLHHQACLKCAIDLKWLSYTQKTGNFLRQSIYLNGGPPSKFQSLLLYPSALKPNMTVHELIICVWIHTRKFNLQCASGSTLTEPARLHSATGLTHCPTLRMAIMERYLMKPIHRSEEVSKEIPHRFVFVCIGGAGVCAESRIALGIPDLFWLVRLQLLHSMGEEGPGRSKTTKFWLFFFFSFTLSPLLSLQRWLPASQLYNQALHLYFIDRCYFLPWLGEYGLFFEPLGKIEFHGWVIYASEGFVNVGLQLHSRSAGMLSSILSRGTSKLGLTEKKTV